jgi:hypothetical protein
MRSHVNLLMKEFSKRSIRALLCGSLLGTAAALAFRVAIGLIKTPLRSFVRALVPTSLSLAVTGVSRFWLFVIVIAVSFLLLGVSKIETFARRLYRSWRAGLITGIVPTWFLISLFLFLRVDNLGSWRLLGFVAIGLIPIAVGYYFQRSSVNPANVSLSIPEQSTDDDDLLISRDIAFDLPIRDWTEDRLSRVPFVRSVGDLIFKDKAPVIAITGNFGEGKTSVLNLIYATLAPRNDLIVVNFSSWLPGDESTLASSLFSTISDAAKERYVLPGLTKELKRFARLLAGTVPKVGDTLKDLFEESSQVKQLSILKSMLDHLPVRIVVLADEIDRMDNTELHFLLKAVRGVVDLPNITYVCAFDKKAITRILSESDPPYGQVYLEKFFPLQFPLPRIDQELLGKLFDQRLESIYNRFQLVQTEQEKKALNDALFEVWHSSIKRCLPNFRRMTLYFNALQMSLEPVAAEINLFDMIILQLVKTISEETYQFIYDNGPLFYYPRWRITLWLERLHVDDKKEAALRTERLKTYFNSLSSITKDQVTQLLSAIFPTVDQALRGERFFTKVQSEGSAERDKRIYHPDYFPRYFIHQVPFGMFGRAEMTDLIVRLNAEPQRESVAAIFRETVNDLQLNEWKRYGFFDTFVAEAGRLGEAQAEGVIVAVAEMSDSFEGDLFGISDWGRARALLFAAAQRFERTPKLQEVLIKAIQQCSSNGFAADILRYSTSMRQQNNVITNWHQVDEAAVKTAFYERMRKRYQVGSEQEFPYRRRDDLSPFFIWVNASDEDKQQEIAFFRDRFARNPVELGRFLGWALPKTTVAYEGDPLTSVERLFPLSELLGALRNRDNDQWSDQERESVQWFLELMQQRNNRASDQQPQLDERSAANEVEDIEAATPDVDQAHADPDDPVDPKQT